MISTERIGASCCLQLTARFVVSTLIVALGIAAPPPNAVAAEDHGDSAYTTEDVSFENDGLTLHGTVLVPSTPDARRRRNVAFAETHHPAVVIVGGSGVGCVPSYLAEARAFAASGVVTLIYDKRTVGYSLTERSYEQLGEDAIAALRLCKPGPMWTRRAPDCGDTARAAGWCRRPRHRIPRCGFVILAGASAHPPADVPDAGARANIS